MFDLETEVKEPWLKAAFREEWPTIGNHVLSCGVSLGAAAACSAVAAMYFPSATVSALATGVDATAYWGTFLPQLLYRDREKLKDADGCYDRDKLIQKGKEFLCFLGVLEVAYLGVRGVSQSYLQEQGRDPAVASASLQTGFSVAATFFWPVVRYGAREWFEG